MNSLVQCLAVGVAGFFGAIARLLINRLCLSFGTALPIGTLFINLSGSFILGWFLSYATTRAGISESTRVAVATGFLGAYTTFSTWMYESNQQLSQGQGIAAAVNLLGSLVLGLGALRLGIWMAGQ